VAGVVYYSTGTLTLTLTVTEDIIASADGDYTAMQRNNGGVA